jgi:hypothetical protein
MKYLKRVRHGDMVLFKMNSKTELKNSREMDKVVVGLGEVTGHSHDVVAEEGVTLKVYSDNDKLTEMTSDEIATMENLIFDVIGGNAVISHDEHDELVLDEGRWQRSFQVEYNPFSKMVDKVRD